MAKRGHAELTSLIDRQGMQMPNMTQLLLQRWEEEHRRCRGPGVRANAAAIDISEARMWIVDAFLRCCVEGGMPARFDSRLLQCIEVEGAGLEAVWSRICVMADQKAKSVSESWFAPSIGQAEVESLAREFLWSANSAACE